MVDVAPLPDGDSRGMSTFYMTIAWAFGGFFAATILTSLLGPQVPNGRRGLERMAALAGYSVVAGLTGALVADHAFGALQGHFWELAGIGALISFAVGAATAALQGVLGLAGTLVATIVFIMFGNSASGGAYEGDFLPGFWDSIGSWLPSGAGVSALRGAIYFDGTNVARDLLLLAGYAVVGVAVVAALGRRRGARDPAVELSSAEA